MAKKIKWLNENVSKTIKNTSLIILGNILLAIGSGFFMIPFNLITGGMAGIAISVFAWFSIPIDVTIAILAWSLFFIGVIFLGPKFSLNTLIGTIIFPIVISIILRVVPPNPIGFDLNNETHRLMAAIFGGVFGGAGVAITFLAGGSTGGVDVLSFMAKKYLDIRQSIAGFAIDAVIIIMGMFSIGIVNSLFGIISAVVGSMMVEAIFIGLSSSYLATIISQKWELINDFIINDMKRGSTIINVKGGFGGTPYQMIQVGFSRLELVRLKDAVARIDPKAFAVFTNVKSINGEGFEPFPAKLKPLFVPKKEIK